MVFRDAQTTTLFVLGATCGEAIIPIILGWIIHTFGMYLFPVCMIIFSVQLIVLYGLAHFIALHYQTRINEDRRLYASVSSTTLNSELEDDDMEAMIQHGNEVEMVRSF